MQVALKGPKGDTTMEVEGLVFKDVAATVGFLDKTTVAVVNVNGVQGIGLAICLPADKYSKDIGTGIAVARAIRHAVDHMEEVWLSRSVSKKDYRAKHVKGG